MVFSLGDRPLPNKLLRTPYEPYKKFPLDLHVCNCCTLAQLGATVPPNEMFDDYGFMSSCAPPLVKRSEELAARMVARGSHVLNQNTLVVEIGSNDGYLLQHYKLRGVPVLGIDPSLKAAGHAAMRGIPTVIEYFGEETAKKSEGAGQARPRSSTRTMFWRMCRTQTTSLAESGIACSRWHCDH